MDGTTQISALIAQTSTLALTPTLPPTTPTPTGLDWTAILVPLLPAVVTGVLVGLIAPILTPYVKWRFVEKDQRRYKRRLKLVEAWRKIINDENLTVYQILELPTFPSIKRMFSSVSMQEFEELRENYTDTVNAYVEKELGLTLKGLTKREQILKCEEAIRNTKNEEFVSRAIAITRFDGEVLRDFLRKELAEIEMKWGLL